MGQLQDDARWVLQEVLAGRMPRPPHGRLLVIDIYAEKTRRGQPKPKKRWW
ncbi:MAG: hypothetical protein ABL889_05640 [Terricaulis sp.]